MSMMAYLITGIPNICSTVCSGTDQRKHQNSASLAFIHRHGWIPLIKGTNAENVSIRWRHHGFADIHSIHKPLRSSFWPGNTFGLQLFSSPVHFVPKHTINDFIGNVIYNFHTCQYPPWLNYVPRKMPDVRSRYTIFTNVRSLMYCMLHFMYECSALFTSRSTYLTIWQRHQTFSEDS